MGGLPMYADLFLAQLLDPFRVGLLIALIFTTARTRQVSGLVIPVLAGVIFVAVLIPTALGAPGPLNNKFPEILTGIAANLVLLLPVAGIYALIRRIAG